MLLKASDTDGSSKRFTLLSSTRQTRGNPSFLLRILKIFSELPRFLSSAKSQVRGVTFLSMSTSDDTMTSLRRGERWEGERGVSPLSSRPDRGLTPPARPEPTIAPEPPITDRGLTPPARRVFCSTPGDLMDGLERDRSHLVLDLDDVWDLVAR